MPRDKVVLVCAECQRRNYNITKNKRLHPQRIECRKFCSNCGRHTIHRETR